MESYFGKPFYVTLFLASRRLPFRGDSGSIRYVRNGNFLWVLEVIVKYDEVAKEHLAKIKSAACMEVNAGSSSLLIVDKPG